MSNRSFLLFGSLITASLVAQPAHAYVFGDSTFNAGNTLNLDALSLANTASGFYWGQYPENNTVGITPGQVYVSANGEEVLNTVTGTATGPFDNYFVFDISGLTKAVSSASITLDSYSVSLSQTYTLYNFGGNIPDLTSGNNYTTTASQLAIGTPIGSFNYTPADTGLYETIALNSTFITAINAAIATNVAAVAAGGSPTITQFAVDGAITNTVAAVPLSPSVVFFGAGLLGLGAMRRKQS